MREICARYGLPYNTGPLHKQFGSVVKKIVRLALPGAQGLHGSPAEESRAGAQTRPLANRARRRLIAARPAGSRGGSLRVIGPARDQERE